MSLVKLIMNSLEIKKNTKLLIADWDNTLFGEDSSLTKLKDLLSNLKVKFGLGVASGRNIHSIVEMIKKTNFLIPDILISSVGSEIYVKTTNELLYTELIDWKQHLTDGWKRDKIVDSLKHIDNLEMQKESEQMDFKISYKLSDKTEIAKVKQKLNEQNHAVKLIISKNKDMDILPEKSGKGKAIEFLIDKFSIPIDQLIVAGDSGNDEDMLTIGASAIVVGNHSEELKKLKDSEKIYFAKSEYAAGIIEGLEHYEFINR
jgi:sucrose-phosphate synthase